MRGPNDQQAPTLQHLEAQEKMKEDDGNDDVEPELDCQRAATTPSSKPPESVEEEAEEGPKEIEQEDLNNHETESDGGSLCSFGSIDGHYSDDDIPDICVTPRLPARRTVEMERFRRRSEDLVRAYCNMKAKDMEQVTIRCQDAFCQKEGCAVTLDEWEDMVYHDLMGNHWTDEGILLFEPSHKLFKEVEDDDLNQLIMGLRTEPNPDRQKISDWLPMGWEVQYEDVPEKPYRTEWAEAAYRLHCLRMKRLLDRASFKLEEWVTTAAAMEWTGRKMLAGGAFQKHWEKEHGDLPADAENKILFLVIMEILKNWPEEARIERVDRERGRYRKRCLAEGLKPREHGGLAEENDMRVRWHCTPYYT